MKLLVSWVRDFVDIDVPARTIADTMALRGFEVASVEALGDGDAVIDFEITANRPDCLSVIGLGREIATTFNLPFRDITSLPKTLAALEPGESADLRVTIEDQDLCPRYAAAVADLTPTQSPGWLTDRLTAAGVRPISPIVDVTNYVLLELGHPMHAFDLATLANAEIRVRRAAAGEALTTLDGAERKLDADMLVIADGRQAQAVAGVMGGAASEVSDATKRIVFESAYFKPSSVRRTSKRLGLKTEASARFERGADINGAFVALRRAVALMQQIGAGTPSGAAVDVFPAPRRSLTIALRRDRLRRVLGLTVPDADVHRILTQLGLAPSQSSDGWDVHVPTQRVDLLREVDLIEEVGRHYGFDKLDASFPVMTQAAPAPDVRLLRDQLTRRVCTAAGLSEAVTFGFIERKAAESFAETASVVPVANPLSAKFDVLRPSLLPGLVESLAHNRRHGRTNVGLFEIGSRFTVTNGESHGVAFSWTGSITEHWSQTSRTVDFFDAKGAIEQLAAAHGVAIEFSPAAVPFLVAGRAALLLSHEQPIGVIGQLAPALAERAGAPKQDAVIVAELDLDRLQSHRRADVEAVTPLPRHPMVVRDLSIVVADALPAASIHGTILRTGDNQPAPLTSVEFFDRYSGKGVPDGMISLSLRLTFQAGDRTLTDAEVQSTFDTILAALVREHAAVQR